MNRLADVASRLIEAIAVGLGYLSGASFLLLSIYISWEALARKLNLPYTGVSDEISGYVLAIAGAWGMAYALSIGDHVRIEAVTTLLPARIQQALHSFAILLVAIFAAFLSYYAWKQGVESAAIDARGMSGLRAPIAIPQFGMALGLTMLTIQSIAILVRRLVIGEAETAADDEIVEINHSI